jgi:hypothetical protein
VTADFPGHLRDALEHGVGTAATGLGPGSTHLYINGAIGGLMTTNPDTVVVDPLTRQAYGEPSHDKARAVGRRLAVAILQDIAQRPLAPLPDTRISVVARSFEIPLDNTQFIAASALRVISRGQTRWRHIRTEVGLIQVGDVSLLCVPGEIYPEIVNGGVTHPPGADFDVAPIEVPPLRSITPGRVVFIVGLANDEIGYIIPQSQWDAEAPWSVPPSGPYGESVSAGPRTGPAIYEAVRTLLSPPARVR